MRPFDYIQGQSRTVVRRKKGASASPDDSITRFSIPSSSRLQLPLEALTRLSPYKSTTNHSPRSSHD